MAGIDLTRAQAFGRLAMAAELFDQRVGGSHDLFVRNHEEEEWAFFDGERVIGVEAAALRAEQHAENVMRVIMSA